VASSDEKTQVPGAARGGVEREYMVAMLVSIRNKRTFLLMKVCGSADKRERARGHGTKNGSFSFSMQDVFKIKTYTKNGRVHVLKI
jgi:hypothetical protein